MSPLTAVKQQATAKNDACVGRSSMRDLQRLNIQKVAISRSADTLAGCRLYRTRDGRL